MYFSTKHRQLTRNIDCPKCSFSFTVNPPPELSFLLCPCCGAIVKTETTLEINSHSQHHQPHSPQYSQPSEQQPTKSPKMITTKNCNTQPNYSLLSRKLILKTVVSLQVLIFLTGTLVVGVLVGEWCKHPVGAMIGLNTEIEEDKPETKLVAILTDPNNSGVAEKSNSITEEVVVPIEPSSIANNTDSSNYNLDSPFALARPLSPLNAASPVTNQFNPFEMQEIETAINVPLQALPLNNDDTVTSDETYDAPENNAAIGEDYQSRLRAAEKVYEESRDSLERNPSRSLILALETIKRYRELGQAVPEGLNSLISLSLSRHCLGTTLAQNVNVERMVLTNDGNWLLTSCTDGTLRLWDIAHYRSNNSGYILDRIDGKFISLLFTPDSRWAVAGTADGVIFVWDMSQATPALHRMEIAERLVGLRGMAMSPDGKKLVAYCGQDNEATTQPQPNSMYGMPPVGGIVWVWEMEQLVKGEQRAIPLRGHERGVTSVAISRDSKLLVTGSEDYAVRVFDLQSQTPGVAQTVLKGHEVEVTCVTIAPDNSWVASGDKGNIVRIWNLPQKNVVNGNQYIGKFALVGHNGWISAVKASPDGRWLASAGYDRSVRLWNMTSYDGSKAPEQGPVLETQNAAVLSVRFNLKGDKLVAHYGDSSIRIWDVADSWNQPGALIESHSIKSVLLQDKQTEISDYQLTDDDQWLVMACNRLYDTNESGIQLWPISPENTRNLANEYTETVFGNTETRR